MDFASTGLSFADGRHLSVDLTAVPSDLHFNRLEAWDAASAQVTVTAINGTDTDLTHTVPVTYRDRSGRVLLSVTLTVIHRSDRPIVSTLATWNTQERKVLRLVRTNQTMNGQSVWGFNCISEFEIGDLQPLKPLDSLRLAALKHSSCLGLEGRDETDKHAPHLETITTSPQHYANSVTDRVRKAAGEVRDRLRLNGTAGENIICNDDASFTPEDVVHGWINSPDHCRNLINPDVNYTGFAQTDDGFSDISPTGGLKRWKHNMVMTIAVSAN
ncbi:hypothetical protein DM785_19180 (plasmid) [Deinococcus actinosclerus]|nr:hypothetical protein DM785_19180 [Deinococcus actinosclerus]